MFNEAAQTIIAILVVAAPAINRYGVEALKALGVEMSGRVLSRNVAFLLFIAFLALGWVTGVDWPVISDIPTEPDAMLFLQWLSTTVTALLAFLAYIISGSRTLHDAIHKDNEVPEFPNLPS